MEVLKTDYILTFAFHTVYPIFTRTIFHATLSSDICRSGLWTAGHLTSSHYLKVTTLLLFYTSLGLSLE